MPVHRACCKAQRQGQETHRQVIVEATFQVKSVEVKKKKKMQSEKWSKTGEQWAQCFKMSGEFYSLS